METWIQDVITHFIAFLGGASITMVVNKIRINNKKSNRLEQSNNTVVGGDITGRDKTVGR